MAQLPRLPPPYPLFRRIRFPAPSGGFPCLHPNLGLGLVVVLLFRWCCGGAPARRRRPRVALRRPRGHCPTTPPWLRTGAGKKKMVQEEDDQIDEDLEKLRI